MKLQELITESVTRFARTFEATGVVEPGTNGPRGHRMTPVRNSAHWLYATCVVDGWEPTRLLRRVASRLRDVLLAPSTRPAGFTHELRHPDNKKMDAVCGVVGPAWMIEALVRASVCLQDERCQSLAVDLFFCHPFSERFGLWHVRDADGTVRPIDPTLDHQMWFAACASEIGGPRRPEVLERVQAFLGALPRNLAVAADGRISFQVREVRPLWRVMASAATRRLRGPAGHVEARNAPEVLEAGYHAFTCHALAILASQLSEHAIFGGSLVRQCVGYMYSREFERLLEGNIFGFAYNPPGFEVPFSLAVLDRLSDDRIAAIAGRWAQQQVRETYDARAQMFSRNTADPATLSARIYEATRLPETVLARVEVEVS